MNAPKGTQAEENEEGGMLVAALAGVGILVAVGLLIFSGGDEKAATAGKGAKADASVASAKGGNAKSAFEARAVDAAGKPIPEDARGNAPKARMNSVNPKMVNEGLAADAPSRKPPTFDNPSDERAWWETQLKDAQRLQGMRQRGMDKLPELEKAIESAADPNQAREQYERRKKRLEKAMENSNARVAEIEEKLLELQ